MRTLAPFPPCSMLHLSSQKTMLTGWGSQIETHPHPWLGRWRGAFERRLSEGLSPLATMWHALKASDSGRFQQPCPPQMHCPLEAISSRMNGSWLCAGRDGVCERLHAHAIVALLYSDSKPMQLCRQSMEPTAAVARTGMRK